MATKAEVEAELAQLKAEHDALKNTVVDVARQYASDHGWCGVVEEALREMGVVKQRTAKVTLEIRDVEAFERMASDLHGADDLQTAIVHLLDMDGDFAYEVKHELVSA